MYFKCENATIVDVQKTEFLSIRRMYLTVQLDKDGSKFSFYWTHSPVIITSDNTYGNRASNEFISLWYNNNLVGQNVLLHHPRDYSFTYVSLVN